MMTNRQMLDTALRQSAIDMCCAPEDFLRETPVTVRAQKSDGARKYLPQPAECSMVSYGHNIVAATADAYAELAREYAAKVPLAYWLDAPYIHALERALNAHGLSVSRTAEYWLPDLTRLEALPSIYETKLLTQEDFAELYRPEWSNALCEKRRELDVLGVGAYDGGRLIGLAGCSADCDEMWQIGVDVLPEYRRKYIAAALTSQLAAEILKRGKVPFYCCAWCNLASARNAVRSGFSPAWTELHAEKSDNIAFGIQIGAEG